MSHFLWGVFEYKNDKGKAAAMYRTVADALDNGNRQLLNCTLTEFLQVTGLYIKSIEKYEKICEEAKENGYIEKLEKYIKVEEEINEEGKSTIKYSGKISDIKEKIALEKTKNLEEYKNAINETEAAAALYTTSILENVIKSGLTAEEKKEIIKQTTEIWEGNKDQRLYLEKICEYNKDVMAEYAAKQNLGTYTQSGFNHFMQEYLISLNDILALKNEHERCEYESAINNGYIIYEKELDTLLEQINEISYAGIREWSKAIDNFNESYREFQNSFLFDYKTKVEKWEIALAEYEKEKKEWIEQMYREATARSLTTLESRDSEVTAKAAIQAARKKISKIKENEEQKNDAEIKIKEIYTQMNIATIDRLLEKRATEIKEVKQPTYALKKLENKSMFELREKVESIMEESIKEAERVYSKAAAQQYSREIEKYRKEAYAKVEAKNRETEKGFDTRAYNEGYTKTGTKYKKTIVEDVSVIKEKKTTVSVRLWEDYKTEEPEIKTDILYKNMDSGEFSAILSLISEQLKDWEITIFGISAQSTDKAGNSKNVSLVVGEFEKYAYGKNYQGEVELGKGLIGEILLDFENNKQKEQQGWAAIDTPMWERKLWCSETFPGPSVREFTTMVASIVATVCTFGAGAVLAVAVNAATMAANELTFELADIGVGYHDWEEAARNVAKAAVSGAITGASGAAAQAVSKSGILAKTAVNAMTGTANNINNAAFSAGSWNGFINNLSSKKQWQSLGISSVGSLVTNGLGNKIQGTDFTGFDVLQKEQINSIAGTVGGLTTNALEWLTFGETTFNLANLSMFGIEYGSMWGTTEIQNLSGGLLSMTIGSTGPSFAISSSGTDISVGTLYSNALGLSHAIENVRIENYSDGKISTILRMQYGYGDKESKALLEEILTGKTKLELEEKTTETTAQTTRDQDGRKTITMYTSGENQSIEELFMQGIVLQHEAHRDGIVSDKQSQYTETINAVLGHTVMAKKIQNDGLYKSIMDDVIAKNLNLQNDLAVFDHAVETGDWGAFGSYVNAAYDSSADYWRVISKSDGTHSIEWDGSRNITIEYQDKDENGNWEKVGEDFFKDDTGSMAGSLGKLLGKKRAEQLLGSNITNSDLYDTQTLKDVLGLSDADISKIQRSGKLPSNVTELQLNKLIGESLLKNNGITWNVSNENNSGFWDVSGLADSSIYGNKLTSFTLTDNNTMGYILFNELGTNQNINNGINSHTYFDRFVVTAELIRDERSFDAFYMRKTDSEGNFYDNQFDLRKSLESQNRGLDEIIYRKYDLNNNQLGESFITYAQTLDVYNTTQEKIDRNQPYYLFGEGWGQGNSVNSNFSLTINSLNTSDDWVMTLHNFYTIGNFNKNWVNSFSSNGLPGGAWGVHSSDYLTSDGCFIYTRPNRIEVQKRLNEWGLHSNHQIYGILR